MLDFQNNAIVQQYEDPPGLPVPENVLSQVANSIAPIKLKICKFGPDPREATAFKGSASGDKTWTYCWKIKPTTANMATRPCFNSEDRT